ncbi:molybdate ABC transporter substrate-binding protein [Nakamurella endophytica]|uniref:molybdate ABC transporter substrate-binding protein n=1 Tax=Nakamurella endophytica TaxID=1748367 RepID=UPI001E423FBB|nr:molybdate ABC transporter substrate-binding protein [Nakamurella endophytica]
MLLLGVLAGCGSAGSPDGATSARAATSTDTTGTGGGRTVTAPATGTSASGTGASAPQPLSGTLTVFAAASLQKTFDQLRAEFRRQHPGVDVVPVSYDGSSTLATQLVNGAPADVFASADDATMAEVVDAGLVRDHPTEFATNTLEIAVAPGNPDRITGLPDLARSGLDVVVCAPEVPCGAAAHTVLAAAGVRITPRSEEQNVTAVLTKVRSGDADAGLVYRTDVLAAGGAVAGVDVPQASAAVNRYPIAALSGARNPAAAATFVALVTGPVGRKVLADAGFGAP